MSPLLLLLTKNETAGPDAIVAKLQKKGWRKPSELGEEYFEQHKHDTPHVWHYISNDGQSGSTGGTEAAWQWFFQNVADTYDQFVHRFESSQHTYWIIPYSDYNQGDLPPCSTT